MASNATVYVNDQDLAALGFRIELVKGPWDGLAVSPNGTVVPGHVGQLSPATDPGSATRAIELAGVLSGTSNADVAAKLRVLKGVMSIGTLVEVRRIDEPTIMHLARRINLVTTPYGPPLIAKDYELSVTLLCDDPFAYDVLPLSVAFAQRPTPIPLGSAPSAGLIRIAPDPVSLTAVNPVIIYRDSAGNALETIGVNPRTIAAADYIDIDLSLFKVTRSVAGVLTSDLAVMSGRFFVLSPHDGDAANAVWPTLEVSAGVAELLYRRTLE